MRTQIESAAQCVLALSAAEADARTYGDATVQLFMDMQGDGSRTDRTLNGPTSDAWLEPWREHLERLGVRFFLGKLDRLKKLGDEVVPEITKMREHSHDGHKLLEYDKEHAGRQPDFYVLALDLPEANRLVSGVGELDRAPDFENLKKFHDEIVKVGPATKARAERKSGLKDMTGVQFFFDAKTSIGKGHTYYPHSEWGLSSISQSEFWSERGGFADGYLGVLSVDVSNTSNPAPVQFSGEPRPAAAELAPPAPNTRRASFPSAQSEPPGGPGDPDGNLRVAGTVWGQLRVRVGKLDELPWPRAFHIDQNVSSKNGELKNATPFLAALPKTWHLRPGIKKSGEPQGYKPQAARGEGNVGEIVYAINHKRWVLCGTFMATHTRMTSMEAANESGRHAARAILERLQKDDAAPPYQPKVDGVPFTIRTSENKTYNHASGFRLFDPPDIWNMEEKEPEDLSFFREIDAALLAEKLPHWMDICDFDKRLELVVQAAELDRAAGVKHLETSKELLKSAIGSIDTVLGTRLVKQPYRDAADKISNIVKKFLDY
jgi:hypothetical protein